MKNKRLYKLSLFVMLALIISIMQSCSDDELVESINDRLFRPVNVMTSAIENKVTVSWAEIEGAKSYYVEMFTREGELDNYIYTLVAADENVQGNSWSVENLEYSTTYYIRIKTNSSDVNKDSYFTSEYYSIKTADEAQVLKYEILDIPNGEIRFSWDTDCELTYINLFNALEEQTHISINNSDGSIVLNGLLAGDYTAVAGNEQREYNTVSFTIPVLYELEDVDNTFDGINLRWTPNSNLSHVVLIDELLQEITIDLDSPSQGYQLVGFDEIANSTTYSATIYYEDGTEGNTISFTTKEAKPQGMVTVSDVDELVAALESATEGAVIGLEAGDYHITQLNDMNVEVYAELVIKTSLSLVATSKQMPKIIFKQFSVNIASDISLVRLDGLEVQGYDEFDMGSSTSYLIDLVSSSKGDVERIEIENCYIHGISNSLVRADRAADYTVKNVIINNNRLYNINGKQSYVATYNSASSTATESIIFTNNTVTGLGRKNSDQRPFGYIANANHQFVMTNNTFYDCQNGKSPFVDARGSIDGAYGSVIVEKNIFYSKSKDAVKKPNNQPSFGEGADTSISGNCMPFSWGSYNSTSGETTYFDWSQYGTTKADPKFKDAANFDFTPTDNEILNAKCGDPRWLK